LPREQEARDQEEDVDAAGDPPGRDVVDDDERDRERPEAL
jgi:hypothetical protein